MWKELGSLNVYNILILNVLKSMLYVQFYFAAICENLLIIHHKYKIYINIHR